jgi:NAD+ kinase
MTKPKTFQRVALVTKPASRRAVKITAELAEWLRRRGLEVGLDEPTRRAIGRDDFAAFVPEEAVDLVIALGGDGTLLSVARRLPEGVPLLGINLGTLGFLTEFGRGEMYPGLVAVLNGDYTLEERSLLAVALHRRAGESLHFRAFNDAVISKGARSRIIELRVEVDDHRVASYRSDGLIVSTPTGSTAYNLSAGGPILYPRLSVIVMTPICPHTLSLRPVVVPDASEISVVLETRREEVYLTVDGQEGTTVGYRDRLAITRSPVQVQLVKAGGRTFYDNLRGKLRWGGLSDGDDSPP